MKISVNTTYLKILLIIFCSIVCFHVIVITSKSYWIKGSNNNYEFENLEKSEYDKLINDAGMSDSDRAKTGKTSVTRKTPFLIERTEIKYIWGLDKMIFSYIYVGYFIIVLMIIAIIRFN